MKQREKAWLFEDSPDSLWVKEVNNTGDLMFVTAVEHLIKS